MDQDFKLPRVAYFCMEFGLHEDFKIYSGGLGILAGDILKAARDKNYPLIGIGILWRQGYTTQIIGEGGKLFDCYPEYSYDFLEDTGVVVNVRIRGRQVRLKVWKCEKYNNAPLYLLDANLPENQDNLITGQLYGWFSEERIAQEMILGIGGVRALRALGLDADVYHFNDSHPVVAGIELIREKMDGQGLSFEEAWAKTRTQIVFTTHTPVMAGNEVHEHELLKYMGADNGLTYGQLLKLGGEPFSMTVAGLRLSRKANAVAELHGNTARAMWKDVTGASEIIAITNGIHNGTWQDERMAKAFHGGRDLWKPHLEAKQELLADIYGRNGVKFDVDTLTIGFARRAAPYKRSDLIFRKPEIITPLLKEKKIQLIFSGKTHPNDLTGKKIVGRLYKMAEQYPESVAFLQNYDMKIGKLLTRGCDVWLNNPIRPMEASGTSGMKAAMNGVLNFSIPDGWWPEGCIHGVNGWQIGDGYQGKDQDQIDAEALYRILLEEVIPTYYENKNQWTTMMRASIEMSRWRFSAARMVEDYYQKMYCSPDEKLLFEQMEVINLTCVKLRP
jgi:starch phosphorylase